MIPTAHKAKIPNTLSYPIGAEAISRALTAEPAAASIKLWFCRAPIWPGAEFERVLRKNLPYRILTVDYRSPKDPLFAGMMLTVYPVLRSMRHAAGQLLRDRGLMEVETWMRNGLVGGTSAGWGYSRHRLHLVFDPRGGTLTMERQDGA